MLIDSVQIMQSFHIISPKRLNLSGCIYVPLSISNFHSSQLIKVSRFLAIQCYLYEYINLIQVLFPNIIDIFN